MLCEQRVEVLDTVKQKNSIGETTLVPSDTHLAVLMCKSIPYKNDYVLKQLGVVNNNVLKLFTYDKVPEGKYMLKVNTKLYRMITVYPYDDHSEIIAEDVLL